MTSQIVLIAMRKAATTARLAVNGLRATDPLVIERQSMMTSTQTTSDDRFRPLALVRTKFSMASNTRRIFRNWPEVCGRVALSWFGYNGGVFTVKTRSGLLVQSPALAGSLAAS